MAHVGVAYPIFDCFEWDMECKASGSESVLSSEDTVAAHTTSGAPGSSFWGSRQITSLCCLTSTNLKFDWEGNNLAYDLYLLLSKTRTIMQPDRGRCWLIPQGLRGLLGRLPCAQVPCNMHLSVSGQWKRLTRGVIRDYLETYSQLS